MSWTSGSSSELRAIPTLALTRSDRSPRSNGLELAEDPIGDGDRLVGVDILEKHRELVATEASGRVARAN
jgi:hypothetical protein